MQCKKEYWTKQELIKEFVLLDQAIDIWKYRVHGDPTYEQECPLCRAHGCFKCIIHNTGSNVCTNVWRHTSVNLQGFGVFVPVTKKSRTANNLMLTELYEVRRKLIVLLNQDTRKEKVL